MIFSIWFSTLFFISIANFNLIMHDRQRQLDLNFFFFDRCCVWDNKYWNSGNENLNVGRIRWKTEKTNKQTNQMRLLIMMEWNNYNICKCFVKQKNHFVQRYKNQKKTCIHSHILFVCGVLFVYLFVCFIHSFSTTTKMELKNLIIFTALFIIVSMVDGKKKRGDIIIIGGGHHDDHHNYSEYDDFCDSFIDCFFFFTRTNSTDTDPYTST